MAAKKLEILQIDFSTDGIVKRDKVSCFHIIEPGRIHQFFFFFGFWRIPDLGTFSNAWAFAFTGQLKPLHLEHLVTDYCSFRTWTFIS